MQDVFSGFERFFGIGIYAGAFLLQVDPEPLKCRKNVLYYC